MGEYTDQEIEMLARFDIARYDADDWAICSDDDKAKDCKAVLSALMSDSCPAVIRAAARLMREAQAHVNIDVKSNGMIHMTTDALDVLLREAREQGRAERTAYHADDVVLARSPLAASCVRQGVTAQAAANAFEYELHGLTKEFIRYRTTHGQPTIISLASDNLARARADGAEEMRERIVTRLRAFGDPDICDAARSVPVAFDESEKEMRTAMLLRQLSDAGDRHDRDECDRLDAEIAAIDRIDQ